MIFPSATISVTELVRRLANQDNHELLAKALELAPVDATVLARYARNLVSSSETVQLHKDRAEFFTRLAASLAPTDATVWSLRAGLLEVLDEADEAQKALAKAFELSPNDPNA